MSGRSFARSAALGASLAVAACSGPAKPEADPALVTELARKIVANTPSVAGAPHCTPAHNLGASVAMTHRAEYALAGKSIAKTPEFAEWINPSELDHPAVRTLADPKAPATARRQAAAEFLAAPSYVVYQVTMVNAPMALEVKELKRGVVGMRAIGYDKTGKATCLTTFYIQNDKATSDAAMEKSDRAIMDPEIAKQLRDDLRTQLLQKVASMTTRT